MGRLPQKSDVNLADELGGREGRRLRILFVSQMPASPPRFGAQARAHGLMREVSRRHEVSALALVDDEFDIAECRAAMEAYCREVVLIRNPFGRGGLKKRLLQLRSLFSTRSFERLRVMVPEFAEAFARLTGTTRYDIINLEFTFLGHLDLRQAPQGAEPPCVVVDSHNIDYDLARQYVNSDSSFLRRLYAAVNWRKLRVEELSVYGKACGVYLCSAADRARLLQEVDQPNSVVIANAADIEYYRPRSTDPRPEPFRVVFFGLLSYAPNVDGVQYFVRDIWPAILKAFPEARLRVIGAAPPPQLTALADATIEFTGFVPDLRPELAAASLVVVPLRIGGGTRLKIVEAMAMGKAIVSTTLGAEGIEAVDGRDLMIADTPEAFASAVNRLLAEPGEAGALARAARRLAEARYAWSAAGRALEAFYFQLVSSRGRAEEADLVETGSPALAPEDICAPAPARLTASSDAAETRAGNRRFNLRKRFSKNS